MGWLSDFFGGGSSSSSSKSKTNQDRINEIYANSDDPYGTDGAELNELVKDRGGSYTAPSPSTVSSSRDSRSQSSRKDTIGQVSKTGQYAGDGFEWVKTGETAAGGDLLERTYTGAGKDNGLGTEVIMGGTANKDVKEAVATISIDEGSDFGFSKGSATDGSIIDLVTTGDLGGSDSYADQINYVAPVLAEDTSTGSGITESLRPVARPVLTAEEQALVDAYNAVPDSDEDYTPSAATLAAVLKSEGKTSAIPAPLSFDDQVAQYDDMGNLDTRDAVRAALDDVSASNVLRDDDGTVTADYTGTILPPGTGGISDLVDTSVGMAGDAASVVATGDDSTVFGAIRVGDPMTEQMAAELGLSDIYQPGDTVLEQDLVGLANIGFDVNQDDLSKINIVNMGDKGGVSVNLPAQDDAESLTFDGVTYSDTASYNKGVADYIARKEAENRKSLYADTPEVKALIEAQLKDAAASAAPSPNPRIGYESGEDALRSEDADYLTGLDGSGPNTVGQVGDSFYGGTGAVYNPRAAIENAQRNTLVAGIEDYGLGNYFSDLKNKVIAGGFDTAAGKVGGAGIGADVLMESNFFDKIGAALGSSANMGYPSYVPGGSALNQQLQDQLAKNNAEAELNPRSPTAAQDAVSKIVTNLKNKGAGYENLINPEMLERIKLAMPDPASGQEFLDMAGRPYGSDKAATSLIAAGETVDTVVDAGIVGLSTALGMPAVGTGIVGLSSLAEAGGDKFQGVNEQIDQAYAAGNLTDEYGKPINEQKLASLKQAAGAQAYLGAGSLAALSDPFVAKTLAGTGITKKLADKSFLTNLAAKLGITVSSEGLTGGGEKVIENLAAQGAGVDVATGQGVVAEGLLEATGGLAAGVTTAPIDTIAAFRAKQAANVLNPNIFPTAGTLASENVPTVTTAYDNPNADAAATASEALLLNNEFGANNVSYDGDRNTLVNQDTGFTVELGAGAILDGDAAIKVAQGIVPEGAKEVPFAPFAVTPVEEALASGQDNRLDMSFQGKQALDAAVKRKIDAGIVPPAAPSVPQIDQTEVLKTGEASLTQRPAEGIETVLAEQQKNKVDLTESVVEATERNENISGPKADEVAQIVEIAEEQGIDPEDTAAVQNLVTVYHATASDPFSRFDLDARDADGNRIQKGNNNLNKSGPGAYFSTTPRYPSDFVGGKGSLMSTEVDLNTLLDATTTNPATGERKAPTPLTEPQTTKLISSLEKTMDSKGNPIQVTRDGNTLSITYTRRKYAGMSEEDRLVTREINLNSPNDVFNKLDIMSENIKNPLSQNEQGLRLQRQQEGDKQNLKDILVDMGFAGTAGIEVVDGGGPENVVIFDPSSLNDLETVINQDVIPKYIDELPTTVQVSDEVSQVQAQGGNLNLSAADNIGLDAVTKKMGYGPNGAGTGIPKAIMTNDYIAHPSEGTVTQSAKDLVDKGLGNVSQQELLDVARQNGIIAGPGTGFLPGEVFAELSDRVGNSSLSVITENEDGSATIDLGFEGLPDAETEGVKSSLEGKTTIVTENKDGTATVELGDATTEAAVTTDDAVTTNKDGTTEVTTDNAINLVAYTDVEDDLLEPEEEVVDVEDDIEVDPEKEVVVDLPFVPPMTSTNEDGETVYECPEGYTLTDGADGPTCEKTVERTRQRAGAGTRRYTGGYRSGRGPGQKRKTVTSTKRVGATTRKA